MKILNTIHEDYHMHSLNYSDGMNTIDEIVQYAGKLGMKKIVITDHSQFALDASNLAMKNIRSITKRRKNVPMVEAGIYVNSDMHVLNDFSFRQQGFDYLKERGYL